VGFEKKKLIGKYNLMNMLRLSKKCEFTFAKLKFLNGNKGSLLIYFKMYVVDSIGGEDSQILIIFLYLVLKNYMRSNIRSDLYL